VLRNYLTIALCCPLVVAGDCSDSRRPAVVAAETPGAQRQELPQATLDQIAQYEREQSPYGKPRSKEEIPLRRRVFQLEEELMRLGQTVWPKSHVLLSPTEEGDFYSKQKEDADRLAAALELTYVGPRKFICGEPSDLHVKLTNRTQKTLKVLSGGAAPYAEIVHPNGLMPGPGIPPAQLVAGPAPLPPGPDDYATLRPGETISRTLPPPSQWVYLFPGRYHLWVSWGIGDEVGKQLGLGGPSASHVTTPVVAVDFALSNKARDLESSLTSKSKEVQAGRALAFAARLENLSAQKHIMVRVTWSRGSWLKFRDPTTGRVRGIRTSTNPAPEIRLDGYPRRGDYVKLSPGESLEVKLVISAEELDKHRDFLRPGRKYEVHWEYENLRRWYLEGNRVFQLNAWRGKIAAPPVALTIATAK